MDIKSRAIVQSAGVKQVQHPRSLLQQIYDLVEIVGDNLESDRAETDHRLCKLEEKLDAILAQLAKMDAKLDELLSENEFPPVTEFAVTVDTPVNQ